MFFQKISLPLFLIAISFFMIQCTTGIDAEVVPTQDVMNLELLGLDDSYTSKTVAKFVQGVPSTALKAETFEAMYQQVAQTTQDVDGKLVNYYVELKEGGPKGADYFLILDGELADGTYMKSGFLLALNANGGLTIEQGFKEKPIPHWSCTSETCSCRYVYNIAGKIDCGCRRGQIGTCRKYYPDHNPN